MATICETKLNILVKELAQKESAPEYTTSTQQTLERLVIYKVPTACWRG